MSNKRQVYLTLHYRDEFSLGEHRQRLGYAAYHWGILITPKTNIERNCFSYDVTDGTSPDPVTRVDHNPDRNWIFREAPNVDPTMSGRLLGQIMIGKVPNEVTYAEIRIHLESIPLPRKGVSPEENCVSWTRSAIRKLQEKGLAEQFGIDRFMADSLAFADQRLDLPGSTAKIINYTSRPM